MPSPGSERNEATSPPTCRDSGFPPTEWHLILEAMREDSTEAPAALEKFCRTYWYPVYAYVRHHGHRSEEAEDLTQEFFARILSRHRLAAARPGGIETL